MNKIIFLAIIFSGLYLSLIKRDWITHSLLTLITRYIKDYPVFSILSFILLFIIIYLIKKKLSIKKRIIIRDIQKIEKEYKIKADNEKVEIQKSEFIKEINNKKDGNLINVKKENINKFNEENSSQSDKITKSIQNSNTNNDINKIDKEKLSSKESEGYKIKIETNYQNIDSIEIYEISNEINKHISKNIKYFF